MRLWMILLCFCLLPAYTSVQKPTAKVIKITTIQKQVPHCSRCGYSKSQNRRGVILASRHIDSRMGRLSKADYTCLMKIIKHESSYNPNAKNKQSTAYGLGQLLRSTYRNVKVPYKTLCNACQIEACRIYINSRYGNPTRAWKFWLKHKWY